MQRARDILTAEIEREKNTAPAADIETRETPAAPAAADIESTSARDTTANDDTARALLLTLAAVWVLIGIVTCYSALKRKREKKKS